MCWTREFPAVIALQLQRLRRILLLLVAPLSVVVLATAGQATAGTHAHGLTHEGAIHPPWGVTTDGATNALAALQPPLLSFYGRSALNGNVTLSAIADDVVGATDMNVVVEDDPVEWASFLGQGSSDVLGFVLFRQAPSPLYHAIMLGPLTAPAWNAWAASGTPAGNESNFAIAAMTLIHESFHWRLLSSDEGMVNTCALNFLPYYLAKDFKVPQSITQTTTQHVPVETTKQVPVTKTVSSKKQVKVNGKWITRTIRTQVTTYVSQTVTTYVDQSVTATVANPLYTTLVADAQTFYSSQPPPYNSGVCPMSPPTTPTSAPAPTPTPTPTPPITAPPPTSWLPSGFTIWTGSGNYRSGTVASETGSCSRQYSTSAACWGVNIVSEYGCRDGAFVYVNIYDANNLLVDTGIDEITTLAPGQVGLAEGDTFYPSASAFHVSKIDCFNF